MVVIFSNEIDFSTSIVMDWLSYFAVTTIRINSLDYKIGSVTLCLSDNDEHLGINNHKIYTKCINSVWFRKKSRISEGVKISNSEFENVANKHSVAEIQAADLGIYSFFKNIRSLGWIEPDPNKIFVLEFAKKAGLNIAATIVTNQKSELIRFKENYNEIVCKALNNVAFFEADNMHWAMYTSKLSSEFLRQLPASFPPCLIQEYIEKEYEIRVFYLEGKCYSMAVFSQNDQQTSVDMRKYNYKKPNKQVPYQLPLELENKIKILMKSLCLNSGSLDFIKSSNGNFVFLEVNPSGQFGTMSYDCNYYLEKRIAEKLSQN